MKKTYFFCLVVLFLFLIGCSNPVIEGNVIDFFGKPVEGVQVKVKNSGFTAVTNEKGKYSIEFAPGTFSVLFSRSGYSRHEIELSLSSKERFSAENITLLKLPERPGVYFAEDGEYKPLKQSKISIAGTFLESISGIKSLSRIYTTENKVTMIIYGKTFPLKPLYLNELKYTDTMHVKNITRKTKTDVNMWTEFNEIGFKIKEYSADTNLGVIEVTEPLRSGYRYTLNWGSLKVKIPITASVKKNIVYDFQYIDKKAFEDLSATALYLAGCIKDVKSCNNELLERFVIRLAECGNAESAIAIANTIPDKVYKDGLIQKIVYCLTQTGNVDKASTIASSIVAPGSRAGAFADIAKKLFEDGNGDRANELFSRAIKSANLVGNALQKDQTLVGIAYSLAQTGNAD